MGVHLYTNGAWTDSGKIYRNSYNLLDYESMTLGKWYTSTGTLQNQDFGAISDLISINENTPNYSMSWQNLPYSVSFVWFDHENNFLLRTYHGGNTEILAGYTDKVPTNAKSFIFQVANGDQSSNPITYNQIEHYGIMINPFNIIPYEPYNVVDWYKNTGHGYTSGAWS